jgi:hypothetical protein
MAARTTKDNIVVGNRTGAFARPFLPSIDIVQPAGSVLGELTDADKKQLLVTKVAEITHFQVGLATIHEHVKVAVDLLPEVRPLPDVVRGRMLQPNGKPAERVSVQPARPDGFAVVGRGVVTDELGTFTLPLPTASDEIRRAIIAGGLGLVVRGQGKTLNVKVELPPVGAAALGEITLEQELEPLPESIVGALIDLVEDIPGVTPGGAQTPERQSVQIELGQEACNIVFREDDVLRRFPYRVLVRLVEPRTTTVSEVFIPSGKLFPDNNRKSFMLPIWDVGFVNSLEQKETAFVERVPVDKPISVDGFRDQVIGLSGSKIEGGRRVPMAGTLGLGYVLNLAQTWSYQGLSLGNLLYSLPLAPGEQQRVAVSEGFASAAARESEVLDVAERQQASTRQDASTQAVFQSAFEEHVRANSSYENEARSSSWGVAGGIGGVIGGGIGALVGGVGAAGGGGKSSNSGNTKSALDGARQYTSFAGESMHSSVEKESAARRRAERSAIRLATETDSRTVTTKVVTNHNKAHALTVQFWEVLRQYGIRTDVEGVTLVCFVPLDLVRFLPEGQPLELAVETLTDVDSRSELLQRYALLHRHADAIQAWLPSRHRDGLARLEDFTANPRADVNLDAPAIDVLNLSLKGTFLPFERLSVRVLLRGGRSLGPVAMDSSMTDLEQKKFGTRAELMDELRRRRDDQLNEATFTGSVALGAEIDESEIVGFELTRAFRPLDYQIHPDTLAEVMKALEEEGKSPDLFKLLFGGISDVATGVHLSPSQLEGLLGGPSVHDFKATIGADELEADPITTPRELPPGPLPIPAIEKQHTLNYRDLMLIERTLQHVVRNTLVYARAVWASLTPEERVIMLEGYTIGLPEEGLSAEGFTDPSQHIPLLNCVANQVLGFYGNCMILPFSIPAALATKLAGGEGGPEDDTPPLTTGAVQEALTLFHKQAFSPPTSTISLPTRGVLGEAVLGHCSSAEKIDLTRFWNWQDSPADEATEITGVGLQPASAAGLTAPSTLTGLPPIINQVGAGDGVAGLGALAQALAAGGAQAKDFDTAFLGQDVLKTLGQKTIETAESARADALGKATQLASESMKTAADIFKSAQAREETRKKEEKEKADKKKADQAAAATKTGEKQAAAVKDLKKNAASYLEVTGEKADDADEAKTFATDLIKELAGGPLPKSLAAQLFDAYDDKTDTSARSAASTGWLRALGLIEEED